MIEKLRDVTGTVTLSDMITKFENQVRVKERLINLINEMEKHVKKLRLEYTEKQERLAILKAGKNLTVDA